MSTAARGLSSAEKLTRGRNRGLELLRATEAAALSVGRWLGRGDKAGTREAGQAVMEEALTTMPFEGRIVIGPEGSNNRLVAGRSKPGPQRRRRRRDGGHPAAAAGRVHAQDRRRPAGARRRRHQ